MSDYAKGQTPEAWFEAQGASFVKVYGNSKKPIGEGWQDAPYGLDVIREHVKNGGNAGALGGKHSGDLFFLDIDVDFPGMVEWLGPFAKTPKIVRRGRPTRGKLIYRAKDAAPDSTTWRPEGEKSPWAEILSTGKQALIPPSQLEGDPYLLVDQEYEVMWLNEQEIAFVWHMVTEGRPGCPKPSEPKATGKNTSATDNALDDSIAVIRENWSTLAVFDHFGLAADVQVEKDDQIRLKDNGGLLIKPNGEGWYCFADSVGGGDSISAWSWHKHKNAKPTGRLFWTVIQEMASAKNLTLPNAKAHTNGVNGSHGSTYQNGHHFVDPLPEEPPWIDESFDNNQSRESAANEDATTLDAAKVIALIAQIAMFQGDARRAGMEALRVLIGKLPIDERSKLYPALTTLFDPYKQRERIDSFLATCAPPSIGQRFQPFSLTELVNRPAKKWYVNPIFGPGDIGDVFGPPGSAKTYGVIDLMFCCCLGQQFAHRFEVTHPLNVAYCAGEGLGGLPARFAAAAQHYQVEDLPGFTFFEVVPQLFDQDSADSILKFIDEWKGRQDSGTAQTLDLLVIDTQHSATVGADENSAQDMGKVLSLAKTAVRELGCAVLLIHHSNKAGTGERGSSAMRGAMDFMIEFKPVAGKFSINCEKLKDSAAWKPQTFSLVELGDSARVWWDEPQVSDQVVNKQDQDVDALLAVLRGSKGTRYTANHLAEAIGIGGSKQIFKLLPKAMREDMHIQSGLKHSDRDPSPHNPLVYWYGFKDSNNVDG